MLATPPKLTLAAALALFTGRYSPAFLAAMQFTLAWETEFEHGFQDDYAHVRTELVPNDPGGATRYGIDQETHPGRDVGKLTLEEALAIYHDGYLYDGVFRGGEWARVRGDDLPGTLALVTFDSAVNPGALLAKEWLQGAVGAQKDGVIGTDTLRRVANADALATVHAVIDERESYYHTLGDKPRFHSFEKGWIDRAEALERCTDLRAKAAAK